MLKKLSRKVHRRVIVSFKNLLARLDSNFAYQNRKKEWEVKWAKTDFFPTWEITEIPKEIKLAVDSEWFPPGASVLDIGCGRGTIAAWFAKQNFKVLGIDWANAAIDRAKSEYGEIPGQLEFQAVDICREPFASPQFEVLLDRGCFHVIPKNLTSDYVKNVASAAISGARLLLISKTIGGDLQELPQEKKLCQELMAHIETQFQPLFEIIKMEKTFIDRKAPDAPVPALAVWMKRL